jgi:hypothetical protein
MNKQQKENLIISFEMFAQSANHLNWQMMDCEQMFFTEKYPFAIDFFEMVYEIIAWKNEQIKQIKQLNDE